MSLPQTFYTVVGSKAIALDAYDHIQSSPFTGQAKKALASAARRQGTTLMLTAASTAKTSTTLTDVTNSATASTGTQEFGQFLVQPGKWYRADGVMQFTNATAADGAKLALHLTGTQTSMPCIGYAVGIGSATAHVAGANETFSSVAFASNLFFTVTADTTSPYAFKFEVTFKPTAEGVLKPQIALQAATGAGATLDPGSYLRLTPFTS
jgi:hypothetical protein